MLICENCYDCQGNFIVIYMLLCIGNLAQGYVSTIILTIPVCTCLTDHRSGIANVCVLGRHENQI